MKYLLLLIAFLNSPVLADRVVKVIDGDTIDVLTDSNEVLRLRLNGIDTPERGAPYYRRATQALADMVAGREVRYVAVEQDRYGRWIADIHVGEAWVNRFLVEQGMAWVYRQYTDDVDLIAAEADAREFERGLWPLPEAQQIPPWEWRRGAR